MAKRKTVKPEPVAATVVSIQDKIASRDRIIERLLDELKDNMPSMDLYENVVAWVKVAKESEE